MLAFHHKISQLQIKDYQLQYLFQTIYFKHYTLNTIQNIQQNQNQYTNTYNLNNLHCKLHVIIIINHLTKTKNTQLYYRKVQDKHSTQIMIFTLPIIIAIFIAILALVLILQPQNLQSGAVENKLMRNQFRSTKHKWQKSQLKSFYFCYLCHKLTNGWFSDVLECKKCGIIIHKICKYVKLRKPQCKYIVAKNQGSKFYHQWRQCSFSSSSDCTICQTVCVGLQTYICIWCRRTRHGLCNGNQLECDFGDMKKFILQPTQIRCSNVKFTMNAFQSLKKSYKKIKQKTSQSQSEQQSQTNQIQFVVKPNKRPVIVIINKKSGGQTGNQFIKAFYQLLNPLQVISILDQGLQKLKLFVKLPDVFFVVAGGDGTICSVINYIKQIPQWKNINPPVAVLPLGTGNDLSRSLGWGGTTQEVNPAQLLQDYDSLGKTQLLDRWSMTISTGDQQTQQEFTVYNYIGVGLDAKICKSFHEMRQKHPQLFFSQFSNKLIYTQMGFADMITGDKCSLHQLVTIKIDGKEISIEEFQNIIFLNIKHWGGGVTDLWKQQFHDKRFNKQSICDGKIQVIGLTDLIHMGQVQVGLDQPFQLAQCSQIQIVSLMPNKVIPIQIDGQPLQLSGPLKIKICRKDQAYILATQGSFNGKISKILNQGLKENIITQQQLLKMNRLAQRIAQR